MMFGDLAIPAFCVLTPVSGVCSVLALKRYFEHLENRIILSRILVALFNLGTVIMTVTIGLWFTVFCVFRLVLKVS
jgi:hypothetical protein